MKKKSSGLFYTGMLLALASCCAHGQSNCTTLIYQGAPLTSDSPTPVQPPSPIMGVITLAAPLTPGVANQTGVAFDFTATYSGLQGALTGGVDNGQGISAGISLTTDSNDNIVAWDLNFEEASFWNARSRQSGDLIDSINPQTGTIVDGANSTPGKWSCLTTLLAQNTAMQAQVQDDNYLVAYWFDAYAAQWNAANTYRAQLAAANAEIAALQAELKKK
jgi:hypothetical protein